MNETKERADITVTFPHGRKSVGDLTAHVYLAGAGESGLPAVVATGYAWMRGTNEPSTVKIAGWKPTGSWDLISLGMSHGQWIVAAERTGEA